MRNTLKTEIMITLAHETKHYDVEYQGDIYNFVLSYYVNLDWEDLTVYLEGEDVTTDSKTQEVIEHFEENC